MTSPERGLDVIEHLSAPELALSESHERTLTLARRLTYVVLVVFVACVSPLLGNWDDYVLYYFQGSLALARLSGESGLPSVERAIATVGNELTADGPAAKARLLTGCTLYSPILVPAAFGLEGLRRTLAPDPERLLEWILVSAYACWLLSLVLILWLARTASPGMPPWVILAGALAVTTTHMVACPMVPVPRGLAILCNALATMALLGEARSLTNHAFLWLAAFLHPTQQLLNWGGGVAFWLFASRQASPGAAKPPGSWLLVLSGGVAVLSASVACFAGSGWAFPERTQFLGQSLGLTGLRSELLAGGAFALGVPGLGLYALAWYRWGRGAALRSAAMVVASFALGALAGGSALYPGVYAQRIGGAWTSVLLAVLLGPLWAACSGSRRPEGSTGTPSRIGRLWLLGASACCLLFLARTAQMVHPAAIWGAQVVLSHRGSLRFPERIEGKLGWLSRQQFPRALPRPYTDMLTLIERLQEARCGLEVNARGRAGDRQK